MTCSEGQTVVVAEDTVYVASVGSGTLEDFRHGLFSVAHGPAFCPRADDADGRMCTEGIGKTAVTIYGCRRPLQALQLCHHASAAHTVCHTLAHCETDDIIVGTDVGGVLVALRMTVKEYDGDACIVRLVDGMDKGVRRVGRDEDKVHAFGHETFNLFCLKGTVVVARIYMKPYVVAGVPRNGELAVEFGTPCIIAALRHTDVPYGTGLAAGTEGQNAQ